MRNKISALVLVILLPINSWAGMGFAGSNQRVQKASASGLPTGSTDPFTISYWHRNTYTFLAVDFGFGNQVPESEGTSGAGRYSLHFNHNYYFWGFVTDWDTRIPYDTDGNWHHISFVSTGSDLIFYRDGVQRANRGSLPSFVTSGTYITLGSRHSAGTVLTGTMDDARIYNRALSASEVSSLASSRSRLHITNGLVSWWKLDEGVDGTTVSGAGVVLDRSGNGNDGTPENSPTWRASPWIGYP